MPLISVVRVSDGYYVDNSFPRQNMTCYDDYRNCNWVPTQVCSSLPKVKNSFMMNSVQNPANSGNKSFNNVSGTSHQFKNCHRLFAGDVIKFGRLVFEVCLNFIDLNF